MRVLLIYPSLGCPPGINHGLASLSGVLRSRGHETRLIEVNDAIGSVPDPEEIAEAARAYRAGLIGFSAMTQQFPWCLETARALRGLSDAPLAIGGVHATMAPEDVAATGAFDYIGIGEADWAFADLVDRLDAGRDVSDCANFWVVRPDGISRNPVGPFPRLEELPPEDFEIFDLRRMLRAKDGWMSILTSRGCPHRCTYCFNRAIVERYRADGAIRRLPEYLRHYPVERVIRQILDLKGRFPEIRTLIFDDDLFTLDKPYVLAFCRAYREAGIDLDFVVNAHVRVFDEEMAAALAAAGSRIVKFGIESGSDRVRREILHRYMSNATIERAIRIAEEHGLHSSTFIMFGLPGETIEEIRETLAICAKARVGRFRWALFYPFPGTESHAMAERLGLIDRHRMEATLSYFEASPLRFGEPHDLFLEKLAVACPWWVNAASDWPCAPLYRERVREIEALDRPAWQARREAIRREDRELSDRLLAEGVPHYSIRYSSVMGVRSDYVLREMEESSSKTR
ncbi:MAG: B12-binding domain-containing radical SAM protein [Planctomycetes bacterium]|nr:B12-binding domain-containing radical SAM protein [Planctomycetota bacterium]